MGKPVEVEFLGRDKSAGATADRVASKMERLGGKAKAVGKVLAIGLATGAVVAGVALGGMAKAAADDEVGAKRLSVALHNNAGATKAQTAAVEDWISKQGVALGVTDDDLRPALGRLVAATHDVSKAQSLASLAMNVSAGTGKSLEAVSTALAKAQNGNVSGLARLGVATKDAAGNTLSLNQITQNLANTYRGQAAAAANTASGQYGRLKLILAETGESIGYKLLPVITRLAQFILSTVIPSVSALFSHLSTRLGPSLNRVGDFIRTRVVPAMQQFSTWARAHLVPALQQLSSFITGRAIPALMSYYNWIYTKIVPAIARAAVPIIRTLRGVLDNVREALQRNGPQIEKVRATLQRLAEFIATRVAPVLGKLLAGQLRVAGAALVRVIDIIGAAVNGIDRMVSAVKSLISWLGKIHVPDIGGKIGGLVSHLPGHADGGRTMGGRVLVGERGPELVDLPRGSRVYPNGVSRNMGGGGGGIAEFVVNLRIDGKTIERLLIRYQVDTGRPLAVTTL